MKPAARHPPGPVVAGMGNTHPGETGPWLGNMPAGAKPSPELRCR
jgi:hypothetical protein